MSQPKKKVQEKKEAFSLLEVSFYFDQVERDRMDVLGTSSRTKEIMEIRSRLLTLPDGQFTSTVRALQGIIEAKTDGLRANEKNRGGMGNKSKKSGDATDSEAPEDQLTPATVSLLQTQQSDS